MMRPETQRLAINAGLFSLTSVALILYAHAFFSHIAKGLSSSVLDEGILLAIAITCSLYASATLSAYTIYRRLTPATSSPNPSGPGAVALTGTPLPSTPGSMLGTPNRYVDSPPKSRRLSDAQVPPTSERGRATLHGLGLGMGIVRDNSRSGSGSQLQEKEVV